MPRAALRTILDSVSYAVVAVGLDGRVVYLNGPAREFFAHRGRDVDNCIGCGAEALMPLATPQVMEAFGCSEFRAGRRRIVDRGSELFYEITPLGTDDGCHGAVVSLQRPERFEELASKLDSYKSLLTQFQAIFDSSSDGIWLTDGKGFVISINNASEKLNGVSAGQVLGKHVENIVENGLTDRSVTKEVLRLKRSVSLIQSIKATGKQLLVTGTPVFSDNWDVSFVVINERDITDLNSLKASLELAMREKRKVQDELDGLLMMEMQDKDVVAESEAMRQVLMTSLKLSRLDTSTILILGESGVGKGLLAKFIHQQSSRSGKRFLSLNCAALPESLVEAELFGYEPGAFTGARKDGRVGLMALAEDGTLFLDEIGELSMTIQAKLLKCLDDREFMPIGGGRQLPLKCNIIAATNRNLDTRMRKRQFRKDLYFRLNTFTIRIPPLRERVEDIFELSDFFLRKYNARYAKAAFFTAHSLELMQDYPFPGNVRELDSIIRKGVVMSEDPNLDDYLSRTLTRKKSEETEMEQVTLNEALDALERQLLVKARTVCSSTREMAAMLGISQSSVVRKLSKHNLTIG